MKNKLVMLVCKGCLLLCFLFQCSILYARKNNSPEYYQITVYHFKDATQEKTIDSYLQNALVPALHKINVSKVGIFKALSNDTAGDKLLYVFIPIKSLDEVSKINDILRTDPTYQPTHIE